MILDLQKSDGLEPRKVASTDGGEYASPCPGCGGRDRFRSWPEKDRYWCRQCGKSGDTIEYLLTFHGLPFREAAELVGKVSTYSGKTNPSPARQKKKAAQPGKKWHDRAGRLVQWAHEQLLSNKAALDWLQAERGLTLETIERFRLGWLDKDHFRDRGEWGIPEKLKDDGTPIKLYVPAGMVIPAFQGDRVVAIKIRKSNPGKWGKYFLLPGSDTAPWLVGDTAPGGPIVIVESELDGILLHQEIGAPVLVLRSASNRPTKSQNDFLATCKTILIALDSDEAGGKQAVGFWVKRYQAAVRAPIPARFGKDITEGFLNGLDLTLWMRAAKSLAGQDSGEFRTKQPGLRPCPLCGGRDFVAGGDGGFFCRACQPGIKGRPVLADGQRATTAGGQHCSGSDCHVKLLIGNKKADGYRPGPFTTSTQQAAR